MFVAAKAFETPEEAKKWVEENFTEDQRREWRSYSQDLVAYVWRLEGEARSARRWLTFAAAFNLAMNGVLLWVLPR